MDKGTGQPYLVPSAYLKQQRNMIEDTYCLEDFYIYMHFAPYLFLLLTAEHRDIAMV